MRARPLGMLMGSLLLASGALVAAPSVQDQLDQLQRQIDELKKTSEPAEPVEIIKQVTEYVSPSGELFTEPQKGNVSPTDGSPLKERVTYRKQKFFRRESMGERIDAAIAGAMEGHVATGLFFNGVYQNLVGNGEPDTLAGNGGNRGAASGSLDITLLGKPMRGTLMFLDLESSGGPGIDALVAGPAQITPFSEIAGQSTGVMGSSLDTISVREAWVNFQTLAGTFSLQAGKVDLGNHFDHNLSANDETGQFLISGLVNNPILEFPANGPGAILTAALTRGITLRGGIQNAMATGLDAADSPYAIAELEGHYNLLKRDGALRVWARQAPRGDLHPPQALGLSWDQRLASKLGLFGRYGKSSYVEMIDPSTGLGVGVNTYDYTVSGGLQVDNFIPSRLKDRVGLGWGKTVLQTRDSEDYAEAYFRTVLTRNFSASLHFQTIFSRMTTDPATAQQVALQPLHVVAVRTQVTY